MRDASTTQLTTATDNDQQLQQAWLIRLSPATDWIEQYTTVDILPGLDYCVNWVTNEVGLVWGHNLGRSYKEIGYGLLFCGLGLAALALIQFAGAFLTVVLQVVAFICIALASTKLAIAGWQQLKAHIYPAVHPGASDKA